MGISLEKTINYVEVGSNKYIVSGNREKEGKGDSLN